MRLAAILLYASVPFAFAQSTVTVTQDPASVSTITVAASSTPPSPQYTNAGHFKDAALRITNHYRALHNASALTWNTSLATRGRRWADNCLFKHSGGPTGENLAVTYPNVSAAVFAWYHEAVKYNYKHPGFSEATGHFTQLVWKDTTSVGCGAVNCTGKNGLEGYLLVCEFWPPGNVISAFQENVLQGQSNADDAGEDDDDNDGSAASSSATATGSTASPTASSTGNGSEAGIGDGSSIRGSSNLFWTVLVGIAAVVMAGLIS